MDNALGFDFTKVRIHSEERSPTIQIAARGRTEGAEAGKEAVYKAAARGTSGLSESLPYLQEIQRSFGRHDVTLVAAHMDRVAREAALGMGAKAFTTGENVAFARRPSLHTAAHEAAHVIQQRAGVQLKSGVGEVGDAYERHANEVADGVVQGRCVEGLLEAYAGHRSGGNASLSVQAVQLDVDPGSSVEQRITRLLESAKDRWIAGSRRGDVLAALALIKGLDDARLMQLVASLKPRQSLLDLLETTINEEDMASSEEVLAKVRTMRDLIPNVKRNPAALAEEQREQQGTRPFPRPMKGSLLLWVFSTEKDFAIQRPDPAPDQGPYGATAPIEAPEDIETTVRAYWEENGKQPLGRLGILAHGNLEAGGKEVIIHFGKGEQTGNLSTHIMVTSTAPGRLVKPLRAIVPYLDRSAEIYLHGCVQGYGEGGTVLLNQLSSALDGRKVTAFTGLGTYEWIMPGKLWPRIMVTTGTSWDHPSKEEYRMVGPSDKYSPAAKSSKGGTIVQWPTLPVLSPMTSKLEVEPHTAPDLKKVVQPQKPAKPPIRKKKPRT